MTGLFRYMDAFDRIKEARRGPQGGLLDDKWFDTYLHGSVPLPSYSGSEPDLFGPPSPRPMATAAAIVRPTAFPSFSPSGASSALGLFAPMPQRDPFNDWYPAGISKALNGVVARLLGGPLVPGPTTPAWPPAQPVGHSGAIGAAQDLLDRDPSPFGPRPLPAGHADRSENQPLVEQEADGGVSADTRIRDVASVSAEVWTSAQFDQCVARGGSIGSLSTPEGRLDLCSTAPTISTIGPGSIYKLEVTAGTILARDRAGNVHSATAKPGQTATMTIDTATGQISVSEPGEDI